MENKPKKRVLFVITLNEIGGAQKFISTLINSLDPERYELTVAAGNNRDSRLSASDLRSGRSGTFSEPTGDFIKSFIPPVQTRLIKRLGRNPNLINDILAIFEIRKIN